MAARGAGAVAASPRFGHIDTMRALAALLVLVHHTLDNSMAHGSASSVAGTVLAINTFIDFGRYGVDLFFIISGYVIPFSLLGRTGRAVPAFAVSRVFRLYPMYWVALAGYLAFMPGPADGRLIAVNATLLHRFIGERELVGLSWTLQVELVFYALSAALYLAGALARPRMVAALWCVLMFYLLGAAVLPLAGGPLLPFAWPTFLALMVGGTLLRFIDEGKFPGGSAMGLGVAVFLAIKLAVAVWVFADPSRPGNHWTQDFNPVFAAVATFLLMNGRFRLTWRPLAWAGTISYSIYLLHPLVAELTLPLVRAFLGRPPVFVVFTMVLAAVLMVSGATYLLIERPCIELGHRIARRLARPSSEPVFGERIHP
jgi:peptidoglycan/LPS O-acetylase OafA/YrhL